MGDATLENCPARGPDSHIWEAIDASVKGHGSIGTYVVERCSECENLRVNHDVEFLGEVRSNE